MKQYAHGLVKELRGGLRVALASLHFSTTDRFVNNSTAFAKKGIWSDELTGFLETKYDSPSNSQIKIVAGDFNNRRCVKSGGETLDCETMPFWTTLSDKYGYADSIFQINHEGEIGDGKRIDYIFTQGEVVEAASALAKNVKLTEDDRVVLKKLHKICDSYKKRGKRNPWRTAKLNALR